MTRTIQHLTPGEAREIVIASQFCPQQTTAGEALESMRVIQLDALTRVEKAHKLSCLARLPMDYDAANVDDELWSTGTAVSFETYTHAACLFPIEDWPLLRPARERAARRTDSPPQEVLNVVLEIVRATDGGATLRDIEASSAKTAGWGWSENKRAAEHLVWRGGLVCSTRRGNRRVYDLPERRIPANILQTTLTRDELLVLLAKNSLTSLGIVTSADMAAHYNLTPADAEKGLVLAEADKVSVGDWAEQAWLCPESDRRAPLTDSRPRLIGPFDNLLRNRQRASRVFDFDYTFEAYKPATARIYGHYVLAVLSGSRLIGRINSHRKKGVLVVDQMFPEPLTDHGEFLDTVDLAASILGRQLGTDVVLGSR